MGGHTSNKSKNDWNKKTYDRIMLQVPKGKREELKSFADNAGLSVNDLIKQAIQEKTGIDLKRKIGEECITVSNDGETQTRR